MTDAGLSEIVILIRNTHGTEVPFAIEPWGEVYPMPAGVSFEVRAVGPSGGSLQVDHGDRSITIYAWPGSTVEVLRDGVEIGTSRLGPRMPVPNALPPGMTIAGFVKTMFGGPAS